MTTQYLIQFCISLFDVIVFWHYMLTFRKRKYVPEPASACTLILLAAVWAKVDVEKNLYLNLLVLVSILSLVTLFFEGKAGSKAASVIIFIGTGIVIEPVGMLLLYALHYIISQGKAPYICIILSQRSAHLSGEM